METFDLMMLTRMRINLTFTLPAQLEKVTEVLCAEAYYVEEGNSRDYIVSTFYRLLNKTKDLLEFELHYVEYKRTKMGRVDKSATIPTRCHHLYHQKEQSLKWTYLLHENGARVSICGTYHFYPRAETTLVEHQIDIDVRLPLIGEQIAKLIAKGFKEDFPRYLRLLTRHVTA
jgi:hypothetical protein